MVAYSKNSQEMENPFQGVYAGGGGKILPPHQSGAEGPLPARLDLNPSGSLAAGHDPLASTYGCKPGLLAEVLQSKLIIADSKIQALPTIFNTPAVAARRVQEISPTSVLEPSCWSPALPSPETVADLHNRHRQAMSI